MLCLRLETYLNYRNNKYPRSAVLNDDPLTSALPDLGQIGYGLLLLFGVQVGVMAQSSSDYRGWCTHQELNLEPSDP